jgi:hypothetical protein
MDTSLLIKSLGLFALSVAVGEGIFHKILLNISIALAESRGGDVNFGLTYHKEFIILSQVPSGMGMYLHLLLIPFTLGVLVANIVDAGTTDVLPWITAALWLSFFISGLLKLPTLFQLTGKYDKGVLVEPSTLEDSTARILANCGPLLKNLDGSSAIQNFFIFSACVSALVDLVTYN